MLQDIEPALAKEFGAFYLEKGREEGREEGRKQLTRAILEKRFGPLPAWAEAKFEALTQVELERVALSAVDAPALCDVLR